MGRRVLRVGWQEHWPVNTLAVVFLIVVVIFAAYSQHRQQVSDRRAEKQRAAICAILANIPGHVPTEIADARRVFARPHHPRDCQPLPAATPKPTKVPVLINGKPGTIIVNPPPQRRRTTRPQPSRSPRSRPHPAPSPTHSPRPHPSPTPTPSPTCDLRHPLKCVPI